MKRLAALVLLLGTANGCVEGHGQGRVVSAADNALGAASLIADLVSLAAQPDDPGPPPDDVGDVYANGAPQPGEPPPIPYVTAPDPKHVWFDSTPALASIHAVDLSACVNRGAPRGYGHARVTFDASGAATRVVIESPDGLSQDAVNCLGGQLGHAAAMPFDGAPVTVGSSFYVR